MKKAKVKKPAQPVEEPQDDEDEFQLGDLEGFHPATGKPIKLDMNELFAIDRHDPKSELRKISKRFAFVVQMCEMARDNLRRAQSIEYCTEEDLYIEYSQNRGKDEKITDIKTMVKANTKMRQAYQGRMDAERLYKHAEAAVQSLLEKKRDLGKWVDYRVAEMRVMTGTEDD